MIGFINLSNDVADLISNLHFFIINYETMHKSFAHENYVQSYNDEVKDEKIENETYFIDRRYQKNKSNFFDRGRFFMKSRNAFSRESFRSPFQRQKKCFVCDKVGC